MFKNFHVFQVSVFCSILILCGCQLLSSDNDDYSEGETTGTVSSSSSVTNQSSAFSSSVTNQSSAVSSSVDNQSSAVSSSVDNQSSAFSSSVDNQSSAVSSSVLNQSSAVSSSVLNQSSAVSSSVSAISSSSIHFSGSLVGTWGKYSSPDYFYDYYLVFRADNTFNFTQEDICNTGTYIAVDSSLTFDFTNEGNCHTNLIRKIYRLGFADGYEIIRFRDAETTDWADSESYIRLTGTPPPPPPSAERVFQIGALNQWVTSSLTATQSPVEFTYTVQPGQILYVMLEDWDVEKENVDAVISLLQPNYIEYSSYWSQKDITSIAESVVALDSEIKVLIEPLFPSGIGQFRVWIGTIPP